MKSFGTLWGAWLAIAVFVVGGHMPAVQGAPLAEVLKACGRPKGLALHIGAGSGETAIRLAKTSEFIVHGIEPEQAAVERAKENILRAEVAGRVCVEHCPVAMLPYVNNLANIILVDDWQRIVEAGLSAAEVLRVLAPNGVVCIGPAPEEQLKKWLGVAELLEVRAISAAGTWLLGRKPRPSGMDEWTHELHDSTRNPASTDREAGLPQAVHWINGIPYTWQIHHYRTAGGRVFLFYTGRRGMSRWGTFKEEVERIEAIDAFSGIRLWMRSCAPPAKGFFPIAVGNRLIVQVGEDLQALDAASGEHILTYAAAEVPVGGAVCDGVLFCVHDSWAKGLELDTGKLLWEVKPEQGARWEKQKQVTGFSTYNPVAGDGLAFLPEFYLPEGGNKPRERILGLELKTGRRAWTFDDPVIDGHQRRWFYHGGRLYFAVPSGFVSVPIDPQKPLVKVPVTPLNRGFAGSMNFFAVNGLFWVRGGIGKMGFRLGENADLNEPIAPKTWYGLNPETGKVVRQIGYQPGIPGWRGRCFYDIASPNCIVSENNEFIDLVEGKLANYRICRGHCGWGPMFGNGFYYTTPTWCIFCYPEIRGAIAIGPKLPPALPVADQQRLERGPAYEESPSPAKPFAPEDWPTYRHNAKRTAGTPAAVPTPLSATPLWKHSFGERITGPVIADGRVYLAVVNQGRLCALDEKTGKLVWTTLAGPRIDTPPTRHGNLLLVGSHDGCVYAYRAADGVLAWRFRAAPDRRLMVCADRVESSWPIPGALLVYEGALYCLAGRITGADGGMHLFALDPQTGKVKWRQHITRTTDPRLATGGDPKLYYWIEPEGQLPNNHLVIHENVLRLPDQHFYWDFHTKDGSRVVPEKPLALNIGTFSDKWPWSGYDRPTFSYIFHGWDIHPECRHPFEAGTMMSFTGTDGLGIVCKRLRREQKTELICTTPAEVGLNWSGKGHMPWQPIRSDLDVHAMIMAGDTAFLAGMDFALHHTSGRLLALSLKDGSEVQHLPLPGLPVYDGLAAARGKLFIALQNGTLLCLGKQ
jgi:outer membrane protein assembly factor BamB/SAM-dependent methyltransferase